MLIAFGLATVYAIVGGQGLALFAVLAMGAAIAVLEGRNEDER
jgi:hypothetical protein